MAFTRGLTLSLSVVHVPIRVLGGRMTDQFLSAEAPGFDLSARLSASGSSASDSPDAIRFPPMFSEHDAIMLLIDPATSQIVDANCAAVTFYGYPRDVLTTMLITDLNVMPAQRVAADEH